MMEERLRETLDRHAGEATASPDAYDRIVERLERPARPWLVPVLALGTATTVVAVAVAFAGGGTDGPVDVAAPTTAATVQTDSGLAEPVFPGIWPVHTWDDFRAADLSGDPRTVAVGYLASRGAPGGTARELVPGSEGSPCGTVDVALPAGEMSHVSLCRPDDGPGWVVTAASTDRFTHGVPVYESPLQVPVRIATPGRLTVMVGHLDGEKLAESTVLVAGDEGPGFQVVVALALRPPFPDALLVRVEHESAADRSIAFAEFRLDEQSDAPPYRSLHDDCGAPAGPPAAGAALREWMAAGHGDPATVNVHQGTATMTATGFTLVGGREASAGRVELCVVTTWDGGSSTIHGSTEDVVTVAMADGAWRVVDVRRSALEESDVGSVSVAMIAAEGSCSGTDSELTTVDAPGRSADGLWALRHLVTGVPWVGGVTNAVDPMIHVLEVDTSDPARVRAVFSGPVAGGDECREQVAREQVRRTLQATLGLEDAVDVVIEVEPAP